MKNCDHSDMTLHDKFDERLKGGNGIARQVSFRARCHDCGEIVTVDYNLAFVDGSKV